MSDRVEEDGAAFRLRDGDGTVASVRCGDDAVCVLNRGLAQSLGGRTAKHHQLLGVLLAREPTIVSPGGVPGLQYPGTVVETTLHFLDLQGKRLNLARGDRLVEVRALLR